MHRFSVWAPRPKRVSVKVAGNEYPMEGPDARGYWHVEVEEATAGMEYGFLLDEDAMLYPDPRSLYQPRGVHGPSAVYDQHGFAWGDATWQGPPLSSAVIYELHLGTFTAGGTFDSATEKLTYLFELGVTHVELMPVAEHPGDRGWGYDGVNLFAVNHHFGGPDGLKRFVNACHRHGLAVILDVVYNHFGPVGNYTGKFGPYVTANHHTPWGDAINFEGAGSDEVRRFFIDNALMWMRDYHVDGLRLDAIHEIIDRSAVHFLEELSAKVDNLSATLGRRFILIAESDLNNPMIVTPIEAKGFGMDAQWSDDFHHALFTLLYEDKNGYYDDFGKFEHLAKAIKHAFVYDGDYSAYRGRSHGRPVEGLSAHHFVTFIQNHDQIGNRARGERLEHLIGMDRAKVALGIVLTAPSIPMLFQGEEFAASSPFLYFADHEDEEMARLVSEGRKREFAAFGFGAAELFNPETPETFALSKLKWDEVSAGHHAEMLEWTRQLIHLRRNCLSLNDGNCGHIEMSFSEEQRWLRMERGAVTVIANLGEQGTTFELGGSGKLVLASSPAVQMDGYQVMVPGNAVAILSDEGD